MKITGFLQKIIKNFLLIFAAIMIMMTVLRQLYEPTVPFDIKEIYIVMAFSFLSALLGFILYTPSNPSEKKMRFRVVLHFIVLETLLIALCIVFRIVGNLLEAIILALQVAAVYILVRLLSWKNDKKEAEKINEKLKAFKKDAYE
ncbi:DUF3021 family protein [Lysinibacillus yapensis]|uniref:DUF3021 family protein n=1 Tax=Ureibacillus yapensis TaxID=2304605 RepID=A0A396S668_9BACL|nr:DUF3021 family protein [Lysinibacillus yapensis]RHW36162.1 DUF3021 family protein [Lysinibacillus yapensis]